MELPAGFEAWRDHLYWNNLIEGYFDRICIKT